MAAEDLLTLAELKAGAKIEGSDQDTYLGRLITSASGWLEHLTERRLKSRTYTAQRVTGSGRCELILEWPITALSSLVVDTVAQTIWTPGDAGEPVDFDVVIEESPTPHVGRWLLYRRAGWPTTRYGIVVTYTAGYGAAGGGYAPAIPEPMKEAVIILARHLYGLQERQKQGIDSRVMDGETIRFVHDAVPKEVRPLVDLFRRGAA